MTRGELDEAAPHNPVCIMDGSYHACYANSAALKLAGLGRDVQDPPTGWFRRDEHGELNGALWERAMDRIHNRCFKAYLEHFGDEMADLVVLSHDPTAVAPDFIRDIEVEQTYVDGQLLFEYSRPGG